MPYKPLISVGFDKNGEADFRVSMEIAELSFAKMTAFRAMLPVAIARAEQAFIEAYQRQFQACQSEKFQTPEKKKEPEKIKPIEYPRPFDSV